MDKITSLYENRKLHLPERYPFAYELHLHTSQGSKCANDDAGDMARACKAAGYTGIFVTDHFFYGNTAIDRNLPWSEWVDGYCSGYEKALQVGNEIGLQVFFGWESSYQGNDFLNYGLDKEWLKKHPEIRDASIEEQYEIVHTAGGIVVHAHPFREASYVEKIRLFPNHVDAVEVLNASHLHTPGGDGFNRKAYAYAEENHLPFTGGSDIHSVNLFGGGMAFSRKLEGMEDFMNAIRNQEGVVLPLDPAFIEIS